MGRNKKIRSIIQQTGAVHGKGGMGGYCGGSHDGGAQTGGHQKEACRGKERACSSTHVEYVDSIVQTFKRSNFQTFNVQR